MSTSEQLLYGLLAAKLRRNKEAKTLSFVERCKDPQTVAEASNSLARLWRLFLNRSSMDSSKLDELGSLYQKNLAHGWSKKECENAKPNLMNALECEELTWNNFIRGLYVVNRRITTVTFDCKRGDVSVLRKLSIVTPATITFKNKPFTKDIHESNLLRLRETWDIIFDAFVGCESEWSRLLKEYSKSPLVMALENKSSSDIRSGITRNLGTGRISWKVFISCLQVLKIDSLDFSVNFGGGDSAELKVKSVFN